MQPFYRPGCQRGFGLHLNEGETFNALLYSFSYTKEDAELVLSEFKNGNDETGTRPGVRRRVYI